MMDTKVCTKCRTDKPLADFPKRSMVPSGLSSWCRACFAVKSKAHYEANRERAIERGKRWAAEHPERVRELRLAANGRRPRISPEEWATRKAETEARTLANRRKYAERYQAKIHNDPEFRNRFNARRRAYQYAYNEPLRQAKKAERETAAAEQLARDIEAIRTHGVKLKQAHHKICPLVRPFPDLLAAAKEAARAARDARRSPEKKRFATRRWKRNHPAAVSTQRYRRRLNFQAVDSDLTEAQWTAIKAAYGHRCAYCHERKPLTQDHVIPVSKGGPHTASNIVPACQPCNSAKGNRPLKRPLQPHLIA